MTTCSSGSTICSPATVPPRSITLGEDCRRPAADASSAAGPVRRAAGQNIELFFDLVYVFAITTPAARGADAGQPGHVGVAAAGVRGPGPVGRRGVRGPADRPHRVHGDRAARAPAGGQLPAHPGLAATAIPELGLAACAAGVVAAVAASDRVPGRHPPK